MVLSLTILGKNYHNSTVFTSHLTDDNLNLTSDLHLIWDGPTSDEPSSYFAPLPNPTPRRTPPPPQIYLTRYIGKSRVLIRSCRWRESCTNTPGTPSNLRKTPLSVVESAIYVPPLINKRARYTWHDGYGETNSFPHQKVIIGQV